MREIKFRGWDKELNFMIDIKRYKIDFNGQVLFDNNDKELYNQTNKIELMQYTGLKDKNDVEIYEGDIVKTNLYNIIGYVYYSSPSFGIKQKNGVCTDYNWSDFNNFEVIGNIYENPDLIKD